MDSTPSSKAIEFLAFQITQNKHNGPKSHATFLFLPTKEPLHPDWFYIFSYEGLNLCLFSHYCSLPLAHFV